MTTTPIAWSAASARALDEIAGPDGIVVGIAADHRDSMGVAMAKRGLPTPTREELTALKLRVARVLSPAATVMLLDAEHSAAQALAAGVVPGDTALVVPLEAQGYEDPDARATTLLADWDPGRAGRLGASGCKLLLPYRPDVEEQAAVQDAVVADAVARCREAGVALVLEPIVFPRAGETLEPARFGELVAAAAARLAPLGPEVLKLQHPGSAEACAAVDAACGPTVPWVLLGGGADAEALERQIEEACSAGASGFIVGRTLFDPGLVADPQASEDALREVSLPLLERLGALARAHATPWRERVGAVPVPHYGWYAEAVA